MAGVRMRHPDLPGQEPLMPASSVEQWKLGGWQVIPGQEEQGEQWPEEARPYEGQPVVRLSHPDLPGQDIRVPESAVPTHRERGWLLVEESAEPEAEPPDDLDSLTVPDLQELLRVRDLPVSGKRDELIERLRAAPAEQEQAGDQPAQPSEEDEA